jgi:hypothetical protein
MKLVALVATGIVMSASFAVGQANALSVEVPTGMQGVWGKHGRCDIASERLTITAHTAGWANGTPGKVDYDPQFKAVSWVEEYAVDNFVMGRAPNILIHNTQGFDMPGEEGYARCGPKLTRMPWPPQ